MATISDVITKLDEYKALYGDIEVRIFDNELRVNLAIKQIYTGIKTEGFSAREAKLHNELVIIFE